MLFSVDAHTIGCHLTGNEVYIRNLLAEYARLDDEGQYLTYLAKPNAGECVPPRFHKRWVSANPYRRLGFDIPVSLRRDRPDLIHVQYTGPLFCRVPIVVSVHDVSFLENPEYFTRFRAKQLRVTVSRTVRAAARVLTPSVFSKHAIIKAYGVPEEKISVVHNAVSNAFRPIHRETAAAWVLGKYGISAPFILTVGDIQPRKNPLGLIRAFEDLIAAEPWLPHHLVFVGKETWYSPVVRKAAIRSRAGSRIHFTGWVGDDELRQFYGACDLFVFPSFYEGFGLPILEAMACGRAVVCSDTSAMPEVAEKAALRFDPHSVSAIAETMREVLGNEQRRLHFERAGIQRAAAFTWSRAAEKTLDAYYEVAAGGKSVGLAARRETAVRR